MALAPLSRTIILYEGGINAYPTEAITIPEGGTPAPPPPPPPPAATAPPSFTGTAQSGGSLTGARGAYTNSPTSFADQWQSSAPSPVSWSNIAGATSINLTLTDALVGKIVRRGEIATNAGGSSAANYSAASAAIIAAEGGGGPAPSYIGPQLVAQADPLAYPPAPANLITNVYHPVGAKLRVRAAATYADLVAGTNLTIDDASFTLTANATTNLNGLRAVLAGIATGVTYLRVRVEESASVFSTWSNVILHGTDAVPALISADTFDAISTFLLSATLLYAGTGELELLGEDRARVDIDTATSPQGGSSYKLIWEDGGAKLYDDPDDFDHDRSYRITARFHAPNGRFRDDEITINLGDYDTTAEPFTLSVLAGTPANAELDTAYTFESSVIAGLDPTYNAPLTITGTWTRARIHDGTSWGSWFTSTAGKAVANGKKVQVEVQSAATYSQTVSFTVALNSITASASVVAKPDPTGIVPTFQDAVETNGAFGSTPAVHSMTLKAGVNVIATCQTWSNPLASVEVAGVGPATLIDTVGTLQLWEIEVGIDLIANATLTPVDGGILWYLYSAVVHLENAQPGTVGSTNLPATYYGDGNLPMGGPLTVAAGNLGIAAWMVQGGATWLVGTEGKRLTLNGGQELILGYLAATGTPTLDHTTGGVAKGVAAAWEKN